MIGEQLVLDEDYFSGVFCAGDGSVFVSFGKEQISAGYGEAIRMEIVPNGFGNPAKFVISVIQESEDTRIANETRSAEANKHFESYLANRGLVE